VKHTPVVLAVLGTLAIVAPAAIAADALSPANGQTVSSRPTFVFDFARGHSEVEFSNTPDLRTGGIDPGAFVDAAKSTFLTVGPMESAPTQLPNLARWPSFSSRLLAGRFFWHVKPFRSDDPATEVDEGAAPLVWGPTRVLTVVDEPVELEGWTIRKRRVSARSCPKRDRGPRYRFGYVISGSIAWSDNAEPQAGRYIVTLSAQDRAVRLQGRLSGSPSRYERQVCSNRTSAQASLTLVDPAGHVTRAPGRTLRIRSR
jgi:hypothetical protein